MTLNWLYKHVLSCCWLDVWMFRCLSRCLYVYRGKLNEFIKFSHIKIPNPSSSELIDLFLQFWIESWDIQSWDFRFDSIRLSCSQKTFDCFCIIFHKLISFHLHSIDIVHLTIHHRHLIPILSFINHEWNIKISFCIAGRS